MRLHEIEQIIKYLYKDEDGKYNLEEVTRAIMYAYDLGYSEGSYYD